MKKIFLKILIIFILSLFLVSETQAADFVLDAINQEVNIGEVFEVKFFVDTKNENINAIEGQIVFPTELLNLEKVLTGSSIINLWLKNPKVEANKIYFSGIIPGGYVGKNGYLFSLFFIPQKAGSEQVKIENVKTFLNDGLGTQTVSKFFDFNFWSHEPIMTITEPKKVLKEKEDIFAPELFGITIMKDPNLFDGQYFLVFETQDKGWGIDHYEVKEGDSDFVLAQSPFLLQNQKLDETIAVKAVDKAMNNTVTFYHPLPKITDYVFYLFCGIIILILFIFACLLWRV
jgi:hypothetical protein